MNTIAFGRTPRRSRCTPLSLLVVAGAALLLVATVSPSASASAPSADLPRCLDRRGNASARCPTVEARVELSIDGSTITVVVANSGREVWPGGPVGVEVPVPGVAPPPTSTTAGVGSRAAAGLPSWVARGRFVVARCEFDLTRGLPPGAAVRCVLPRHGLVDGEHTLWLNGFVGGVPRAGGVFGTAARRGGVAAVSVSRSVRFVVRGDEIEVLDADAAPTVRPQVGVGSAPRAEVTAADPAGLAQPVLIGLGLAAAVAMVLVVRRLYLYRLAREQAEADAAPGLSAGAPPRLR